MPHKAGWKAIAAGVQYLLRLRVNHTASLYLAEPFINLCPFPGDVDQPMSLLSSSEGLQPYELLFTNRTYEKRKVIPF
jgi:hypothetical protein